MVKDNFGETPLYPGNIMDEPSLSDVEKVILFQIQFRCRLSKEASTESNKTIGIRASKSLSRANKVIGSLEEKGWINRITDYREKTQRRIVLTDKCISLITVPFIKWYIMRVGKFAYPPLTKQELEPRVNRKDLETYLPQLIEKGWIKQ